MKISMSSVSEKSENHEKSGRFSKKSLNVLSNWLKSHFKDVIQTPLKGVQRIHEVGDPQTAFNTIKGFFLCHRLYVARSHSSGVRSSPLDMHYFNR